MPALRNPEPSAPAGGARGSSRVRRLRFWHLALLTLLLAAIVATGVRSFVVDVYTVEHVSMRPTLQDSERILVERGYSDQHGPDRGDVVVFDGTGSFTPYESEAGAVGRLADHVGHWLGVGSPPQTFVKRVIGVGGDTVACCAEDGRLTIDGEPLEEPYLLQSVATDRPASEITFEVEVPPGRLWMMGDNREESVDSRALLGAPGGGMISEERLIGRATQVFWPWNARRSLQEPHQAAPDTSIADDDATPRTRTGQEDLDEQSGRDAGGVW